jgi:hypothetical protein
LQLPLEHREESAVVSSAMTARPPLARSLSRWTGGIGMAGILRRRGGLGNGLEPA